MQWIKVPIIRRPFFDPRTGKVVNIEGRRNRPKVDPFQGGGRMVPEHVLSMKKDMMILGRDVAMVLTSETQAEIDKVKAMSGKVSYQAGPKEVREYALAEHAPQELDDTAALRALKEETGLPEGTTLDKDKKPIIPKEIER